MLVVLSLAIGLFGSATSYRAADLLFWRDPPGIERADEIRRVWIEGAASGGGKRLSYAAVVSYPDFVDLRASTAGIIQLAAYVPLTVSGRAGSGTPLSMRVGLVSPEFLEVVGARAKSGRLISFQEAQAGTPVALVSARGFARLQAFATSASPGGSLRIGNVAATVVGVVDREFVGLDRDPVDVWLPIAFSEALGLPPIGARNAGAFSIIGRLKVGQAAAEQVLSAGLRRLDEGGSSGLDGQPRRAILGSIRDDRLHGPDSKSRLIVFALCAISGIVLMIAVGNALILTLMRMLRRQTILATKVALGAPTTHLVRDQFVEIAVPCLVGAGLGLGFALGRSGLLGWIGLPANGRGFGANTVFAVGISTLIVVGALMLGPLVFARKLNLIAALRRSGVGGLSGSVRRTCLALLGVQLLVSTTLSIATLSFAACLRRAYVFDYGFDVEGLYAIDFLPQESGGSSGATRVDAFVDRLRGDARISQTSVTDLVPFHRLSETVQLIRSGEATPRFISFLSAQVDTGFLRTTGMRLRRGRWFNAADMATPGATAVVNDEFIRDVGAGQELLDRCVPGTSGRSCERIVGVVADASVRGLRAPGGPLVISLLDRRAVASPSVLVRFSSGTKSPTQVLHEALSQAGVPAGDVSVVGLQRLARESTATWRTGMLVFGVASLIACLLSFVGAVAIVAYEVSTRGRELGIRQALGATGARLTWDVGRQTVVTATAAVALGAFGGVRLILYLRPVVVGGVLPLTAPAVGAVLSGAAIVLVGVLVPTSRFVSKPPIQALRLE